VPMSRGVKTGIVGGVFLGMLGVAGYGAYNIYSSLDGSSGGSGQSPLAVDSPISSQPPSAKEVTAAADAFLTAWSSGDTSKAAGLTDSPSTATTGLTDYRNNAHVTSATITPGVVAATRVPYTITAHVSYQGVSATWTYGSALKVVRGTGNKAVVQWAPSVLQPDLTAGDTLVTGVASTPDIEVVDRHGKVLTSAKYPSLVRIIPDLRTRYGSKLKGGTPAVQTYIEGSDGTDRKVLKVLRPGRTTRLKTTLDAGLQAAAEKAVSKEQSAGVTAVDVNTGGILAIANNLPSGTDLALQDQVAPGSTFKVVTAAALIEKGHLTPQSPAPCINGANYGYGRAYKNDGGMSNAHATLDWDFAESCNTGFIKQAGLLGSSGLVDTAARFGLTQKWNIGTPYVPASVPGGTGDELTSEMIGQGQVQANPLVMASVAATARSSDFHQPRIVSPNLLNSPPVTARGISPTTSQYLRDMMRSTVTYGTAKDAMAGFGTDTGAKTGSAEIDGAAQPNGWFVAYHGDVAASAVVHGGGHGNASAGPIVAAVLRAGS
jgi:hypothetical protein